MALDIGARVTLARFCAGSARPLPLEVPDAVLARLRRARAVVDRLAAGPAPVYGLNTGLGGNLGHRLAPDEIAAFQAQIVAGRAVAIGDALPEATGRGMLLARIVSAARGRSGMSPELFLHLVAVYRAGLSPVVPEWGSIGAADLTVNAVWAQALLGQGEIWADGARHPAAQALEAAGLAPPDLQPRDAMALINTGAFSVARSAVALQAAREAMAMTRGAALLSYAGYGANRDVLRADINALRPAPGQAEAAAWFADRLAGQKDAPRRVQEALSFRLVATVTGAAADALARAVAVWEDEANAGADSPAVLAETGEMLSTAHFHAPALALALEGVALAMAMLANGAVQRVQKLMDPGVSGLPKYLSPVGGASAGMVPMQKTCAALLAEIRRQAMPVAFDPAPVSDSVEDMAPQTPLAAAKLAQQMRALRLLTGAEALAAAQAIDLRGPAALAPEVARLHRAVRARVTMLEEDRALGPDIAAAADALEEATAEGA